MTNHDALPTPLSAITASAIDPAELTFRFLRFAESVRSELTDIATEANLLLSDLLALRVMSEIGSPIYAFELAFQLGYSRSYMTEITQRLLAAGYIAEHRNPIAPRSKRLSMTQTGRDMFAETMEMLGEQDPFTALTARERLQLGCLLEQLASDPFANEVVSPTELSASERLGIASLSRDRVSRQPNRVRERR